MFNHFVTPFHQCGKISLEIKLVKNKAYFTIRRCKMKNINQESTVLYGFKVMLMAKALKVAANLFVYERVRPIHRGNFRLQVSCLKQMFRLPGDRLAKFNQTAGDTRHCFFI